MSAATVCVDKATIVASIEARLISRFAALGLKPDTKAGNNEEAAFLAGAAAALHAVFGEAEGDRLTNMVPPLWILYPMSGRSVVAELKKKGGV